MKKVNKITALVMLILVATTVSATISLVNAVTANAKLRKEVRTYKSYYNASEALFEEIEDYNENLFDSDKAIDYYNARLPISNE
jgi:cell division protein FtsB